MRTLLVSMSLFMSVALSAAGLALAADPAAPVRRDEARLINQVIPPELLGSSLRVWDGGAWRPTGPAELTRTQAKVLVVNLWATYCKPCLTELPVLREMAKKIEAEFKQEVQFIFLSETSDPVEMKAFFTRYEKLVPSRLPLYLDENENIASALRYVQPGGNLSLPTTLILDDQRNVRYAMIGALLERRSELLLAVEDAVRSVRLRSQK